MINKQSMWFLTLLSLTLILGVYYVTMPSDLLKTKIESTDIEKEVDIKISELDSLVAMKAKKEEKKEEEKETLENIITNETSSIEEKNEAYEDLKVLNLNISKEEILEEKIETTFGIKSVVEITKDSVKVIINSKEHDKTLANNIMRCVAEEYEEKVYITVEFE